MVVTVVRVRMVDTKTSYPMLVAKSWERSPSIPTAVWTWPLTLWSGKSYRINQISSLSAVLEVLVLLLLV